MQYPLVSDMDRKVFAEELAPRLPKKLFDAHVHVFNKDCFPPDFNLGEKSCYQKFGGEHRSEFCVEMYKKLLPSIDVTFNCFFGKRGASSSANTLRSMSDTSGYCIICSFLINN